MELKDIKIHQRPINPEEYLRLRATTGWDMPTPEVASSALSNDLFSVCACIDNKLIGMARVIGDGGLYFYIQDVVVHPDFQGKGVGRLLMKEVEQYLEHAPHNAFIGLMAAEGVMGFYESFGYAKRPDSRPGMYKLNLKKD